MSHLMGYLLGATCRTQYLLRRVIRCDSVAPIVAPNKPLGATFEALGATFVAPDNVFCPSVDFSLFSASLDAIFGLKHSL